MKVKVHSDMYLHVDLVMVTSDWMKHFILKLQYLCAVSFKCFCSNKTA